MKSPATFWPTLATVTLALLVVGLVSAHTGPVSNDPSYSLWQVRLPRFCTAAVLGAALGLCGMLLQLATRNPLSEPELLGINQSAVFAVVLLLLVAGSSVSSGLFLLAALAGGAVTGGAVLLMSASGSFPRERLILAGLTLAFFFGSASSGLLLLKETDLFEVLHWTAGKLSGSDWGDVTLSATALAAATALSVIRATQWNALQLGEEGARNLGVDPGKLRLEIVALAVILCSVSVAVAGPIGFVGIIVPHLSALTSGLDYRRRLPTTLVAGALLVAVSDLVARTVIHPAEIPVGILTALVGAPYFLYRAQKL